MKKELILLLTVLLTVSVASAQTSVPTLRCISGGYQCDEKGYYIQKCDDATGQWYDAQYCPNGCKDGTCTSCNPIGHECASNSECCSGLCINQWCEQKPPTLYCTSGAYQCDEKGYYIQKCDDTTGQWFNSEYCPNGCDNGICKTSEEKCASGTYRCDEKGYYIQKCDDTTGQWFNAQSCPNGCKDGACISSEEVREEVTCVFHDSYKEESCYSEKGECLGMGTCVTLVYGKPGEQVTWKSSCGGYVFTIIDGNSKYAEFECGEPTCRNGICELGEADECPPCEYGVGETCTCKEGTCPEDCQGCVPEWVCTLEPPTCPEEGIQNKVCVDTRCGTGEQRVESLKCMPGVCNGCFAESICYPVTIRMAIDGVPSYCDVTKDFAKQREEGETCQNSYECKTNECSSGECIDIKKELEETRSLLQKILEWLGKWF